MKKDLYTDTNALKLSFESLKKCFLSHGVVELYYKELAPNDNSKNQPYFGGDVSSLSILPIGEMSHETSTSRRYGRETTNNRVKITVDFCWLDVATGIHSAPNSKLILYPQFPEVRFSGFLAGANAAPSTLMDPKKRGREAGRILFLGVTSDDRIVGYVATNESTISAEIRDQSSFVEIGVFKQVALYAARDSDGRVKLIEDLKAIRDAGWIPASKLNKNSEKIYYDKPNAVGYTLEAELGILPNGVCAPDYRGWELKAHKVSEQGALYTGVTTLMTPEPNFGYYTESGVEEFVKKYGYPDKNGVENRLNFGGVHRCNEISNRTYLTMALNGYPLNGSDATFDFDGFLFLYDSQNVIAAGWTFDKLLEMWSRKHNKTAFVPFRSKLDKNGKLVFKLAEEVSLRIGTDFILLLQGLLSQKVYYDPGIKLTDINTAKPKSKRRSQFRVKAKDIDTLYKEHIIVPFD